MTTNLWSENKAENFWQSHRSFNDDLWKQAVQNALPILQLQQTPLDENHLLELVLGEGQFGLNHFQLSKVRRFYYLLKPLVPRILTRVLRQLLEKRHKRNFELGWPIEDRYPRFQFEVLKNMIDLTGSSAIEFHPFWPDKKRFAFVLTHDIEGKQGQQFARAVADMDESFGFRSSFNFVPEKYHVDKTLVDELRQRGFEVGIHGLKHDGKLFNSYAGFMKRAEKINKYLEEFDTVGFRSPLTHRNPEWMQALEIEYDLSFFDTDPFEPMPGGVMSIWPFFIGKFVELPYTLAQDYTLMDIMQEKTARLWLEKIEFIQKYYGMALVNSHPDYLINPSNLKIYSEFLSVMKERSDCWRALPGDVAKWWRARANNVQEDKGFQIAALNENGQLTIG